MAISGGTRMLSGDTLVGTAIVVFVVGVAAGIVSAVAATVDAATIADVGVVGTCTHESFSLSLSLYI